MGSMSQLLKSAICPEVSNLEKGNDVFFQNHEKQEEE